MNTLSSFSPSQNAPVLCLVGPTASGKTAAALALAQEFPIEIISLDSALVYREMDIGTAKPSAQELAAVPHHLINIIDPNSAYSAAQFANDAQKLVKEIRERGKQALIVGGTMLYYKAFAEGLNDLPQADAALRAEIEMQAAVLGWPAMHAQLAEVDAITAARLHTTDAQRIGRALEIYKLSGQAMSTLLTQQKTLSPAYATRVIALEPSDRSVLHQRIAIRFEMMLQQGLIEEVAKLKARGDLHPDMTSMRCVGYRQTWSYLDGEFDLDTLREKGIAATRQLCKRQLTWLRSMPERIVVDCLAHDMPSQILQQASPYLIT